MSRTAFLAAALSLLLSTLAAGQTTGPTATGSSTFTQSGSSGTTSTSSGQTSAASAGSSTASGGTTAGSGASAGGSQTPQPVPYSPDEFPVWLRDLHRGEAITVGAFPFTLLISSLSYQLYRYAAHQFATAYSPGLFGSTSTPLSTSEQIGVLVGGVGLAAVVALVDFILGLVEPAPAAPGAPAS